MLHKKVFRILLFAASVTALASSCTKNNGTSPTSNTGNGNQQTTLISRVYTKGISNQNLTESVVYIYNDKLQIVTKYDTTKSLITITQYLYDASGKIIAYTNKNGAGQLMSADSCYYNAKNQLVKRLEWIPPQLYEYDYFYDLKGQVSYMNYLLNKSSIGSGSYTYDTDGNIASSTSVSGGGLVTYTYDNKKSYLATGKTVLPGVPWTTQAHNELTENDPNSIYYGYAYTYNSDGYPVSSVNSHQGAPESNSTYTYIKR